MLNFSATQEIFDRVRPRYYALADPMFFAPDHRIEKVRKLFDALNSKVTWEMTLVITTNVKSFIRFSQISNPNIKFKRVYHVVSPGCKEERFQDYKNGDAVPFVGTVANLAVYLGIQLGYKDVELCGVDMSLFDGLCVNDKNETCTTDFHYYDGKKVVKPYIDASTGRAMRLDNYIDMVLKMVRSHRELAEYGHWLNVRFLNRTRGSMLDCFPRMGLTDVT